VSVLLWGRPVDPVISAVAAACARQGVEVVTADTDSIASLLPDEELVTCDGHRVRLGEVTGVFVRPVAPVTTPQSARTYQALTAWTQLTATRVLNRPAAAASNRSKPYQLGLISAAGFATPDTLVTTDPDQVRRFWAQHGRVIYKSVSGTRSIVAELSDGDVDRIPDVTACPTQFQQYIPGTDYRVHVVDTTVLACRIESTATDYRYAAGSGQLTALAATGLPADVASRCVALTASLGLALAGVDLRVDAAGRWWCFEVNTAPGFSWFEQQTGLPIAAAVAATLAG
jgi:glutathione synthase/RimK-type ligase-like ATP-grasp enzyme